MKTRYAVVLIAAVSILIYANSLNNAFQYDDYVYLEENSNIKTIRIIHSAYKINLKGESMRKKKSTFT